MIEHVYLLKITDHNPRGGGGGGGALPYGPSLCAAGMGSHIFGFLGYKSSSYFRLANVPEYLFCR